MGFILKMSSFPGRVDFVLIVDKLLITRLLSFVVQVETYAGQADVDVDCPGLEYSAEPWSDPIGEEFMDNSTGVDCLRWCLFTETCFAGSCQLVIGKIST